VAALAVAESIERSTGVDAQVKWPNDVWIHGRKVAGILLEATERGVVCGIGVNANQTADELPTGRVEPTSLRVVTGSPHDRSALLADLLLGLERHYDAWQWTALGSLLPGLERRDALRGRIVRVGGLEGTADGIEADGRLAVVTAQGERALVDSGEVEVEVER